MDERKAGIRQSNPNWFRNTGRNLGVMGMLLLAAACSPANKGAAASTPVHELNASAAASGAPAPNKSSGVSAEGCVWENREGKRQPPIGTQPVTVRVDGKCDPDPSAPIGIYPTAKQEGQPLALVNTDDALTVQCYTTNAEPVQDTRGDIIAGDQHVASSPVWLGVTTPDGTKGKIPETWTGFTGVANLAALGIHECSVK